MFQVSESPRSSGDGTDGSQAGRCFQARRRSQASPQVALSDVLLPGLAKQFVKVFEAECSRFQYALSTRAGTDCVGHMLRAATDSDPSMTILSVDGIGAYDHIFRSATLGRLLEMPGTRELLPFVRLSYAQPSCYGWHDQEGRRRTVTQAER